jgi:molybdopterin molybdotransferase
MLSVEEARRRLLAAVGETGIEWVGLENALDRVLAADVAARHDQPRTAVSAMDGYAVRAGDTGDPRHWLRVVGENRAGETAVLDIQPGEAARVFTGSALPAGADAVAIQENATREGDRVRFSRPSRQGEFVRPAGLDFDAGWVGLRAGEVLGPRRIGLAAALGHCWLPVRCRPQIGILASGDELVRPGEPLGPDRIVSSNTHTIAALLRRWGAVPVDLGIAADDLAATEQALARPGGLDLLVTSGGASVGEYDLIQSALLRLGAPPDFWKIAMRPGKPMMFARIDRTPLLGLPGNPVSATVCSMIFLRAMVRRMLNLDPALETRAARVVRALPENDEREEYLRARIVAGDDSGTWVEPAARQDSSMFATMTQADVLIVRPPHAPQLAEGQRVPILDLDRLERSVPSAISCA